MPRPSWVSNVRPRLAGFSGVKIRFFLMSPKYCLPVCSLLLLALFLPGCGGGLAATTQPDFQPGAPRSFDHTQHGDNQRWHQRDHRRHRLPIGSHSELWRDPCHGRDPGKQHIDHSHHSSPRSRGCECHRHQHGRTKRHPGRRLYLCSASRRADRDCDHAQLWNHQRRDRSDDHGVQVSWRERR